MANAASVYAVPDAGGKACEKFIFCGNLAKRPIRAMAQSKRLRIVFEV